MSDNCEMEAGRRRSPRFVADKRTSTDVSSDSANVVKTPAAGEIAKGTKQAKTIDLAKAVDVAPTEEQIVQQSASDKAKQPVKTEKKSREEMSKTPEIADVKMEAVVDNTEVEVKKNRESSDGGNNEPPIKKAKAADDKVSINAKASDGEKIDAKNGGDIKLVEDVQDHDSVENIGGNKEPTPAIEEIMDAKASDGEDTAEKQDGDIKLVEDVQEHDSVENIGDNKESTPAIEEIMDAKASDGVDIAEKQDGDIKLVEDVLEHDSVENIGGNKESTPAIEEIKDAGAESSADKAIGDPDVVAKLPIKRADTADDKVASDGEEIAEKKDGDIKLVEDGNVEKDCVKVDDTKESTPAIEEVKDAEGAEPSADEAIGDPDVVANDDEAEPTAA